ncbi:hypothetical protein BGW38_005486 [Lunasporangiospora selenospora]|uniref:tRNA-5-taurinomethyluridine 2-sulfurtransferase n=1 Tax=Lunasporangiospora selenospora TaxID=979761 RepID=A0A9P6G0A4_9FUNG|nr:hypothetical protein BGW38_005486 [Lunasporangiospora selenospora]
MLGVASAQTKPSIPEHTGVDTLPPQSSATKRRERVLLMMSGGVDSSVSAHILQKQGYDVTGLYMHNWNHDQETQDETPSHPIHGQKGHSNIQNSTSTAANVTVNGFTPRTAQVRPKVCTSDRDWADVQAVCSQLGIPARRLDFSRQYWNQVFEIMLDGYRQGRTPNPDVSCNREIKFGKLIEWCQMNGGLGKDRPKEQLGSESSGGVVEYSTENVSTQGWDYLATGHYARVEIDPETGHAKLKRAHDSNKDQTYYLSTLPEKVLRHVLFPLAAIDKPIVKQIASQTGVQQLENAAMKKESMGICFVGKRRRFGEFLQEYLEGDPGPVRVNSLNGPIIGQHKGLYQYTIGQASGVTNGSQKWVVLRPDLASNTLIVVDGTQNKRLFFPGLIAESWHWIAGHPPKKLAETSESTGNVTTDLFPFTAQIRHRQVPRTLTM